MIFDLFYKDENAENKIAETITEIDFDFVSSVAYFFNIYMSMTEGDFSKLLLNATKDYYAYLKSSKNKISDDKLENLLANLLNYETMIAGSSAMFEDGTVKAKICRRQLQFLKEYITKLESYFATKRANRVNEKLCRVVKDYEYIYAS